MPPAAAHLVGANPAGIALGTERSRPLDRRRGRLRYGGPVALGALLTAVILVLETLPDSRTNNAVAIAALDVTKNASFVWAGVLGVLLRPKTLIGPTMIAVGVASAMGNLVFAETIPLAYTVGLLSIGLLAAPLSHMLLAYPDGRLRGRSDRAIVVATYVHLTVQWGAFATTAVPRAAGCERCSADANLVGFFPDAELYESLLGVQVLLSGILALLVLWRLAARWHAASPAGRSLLGPVLAGGLFCAFATLITASFAYDTLDASAEAVALHAVWLVAFGTVSLGYCVGLVRDAVRRTRLGVLLAELSASTEALPLRAAVRRALGDPTADVVISTANGLQPPQCGRVSHRVRDDTVLLHDPVLLQERELIAGVARAVALALENQRLELQLSERLAEAQEARARVVEAGDQARRQIERDLHDGLQQTLVSLRVTLRLAQAEAALDGDSHTSLEEACELAAAATQDLRALAQGVYPMVLTASGLSAALRELGDVAPVAVTMRMGALPRSTPPAEAAAYFCCCEAVTNVAKHAGIDRCEIRGGLDAGTLRLAVVDEGIGGAHLTDGSGLRGLRDRAAAVGGDVSIESPLGGPTVVRIQVPWPPATSGRQPV